MCDRCSECASTLENRVECIVSRAHAVSQSTDVFLSGSTIFSNFCPKSEIASSKIKKKLKLWYKKEEHINSGRFHVELSSDFVIRIQKLKAKVKKRNKNIFS